MAPEPSLRVLVDGDTRVYRQGEQIKGRVILVLEEEEEIKNLKVEFTGLCITRTTRPFHVSGTDADCQFKRNFEERVKLFNIEQALVVEDVLPSNKYTWNFDFTFPGLTEPQQTRRKSSSKYQKDRHPLPSSFHIHTAPAGGQAMISYQVEAKLVRGGMKGMKKASQLLPYSPSSPPTSFEPRVTSRILYAQTWKPVKDTRTVIDRVFTKVSRRSPMIAVSPQIVPTLYYAEKVAPGQRIPLLLSLANVRDAFNISTGGAPQCTLDSLTVTISTYTTSICRKSLTQPEDVVSKHVTCISRQDINQPLSFSAPTPLTSNFRLVDDAECVPTFKTYTITRRYTMTIVVGIKYEDQKFDIKTTTPLEILPRISWEMLMRIRGEEAEEGEIDPLPLYVERDVDMTVESAPSYETLYTLTPTSSASSSYDLISGERDEGLESGTLTPRSELERLVFT